MISYEQLQDTGIHRRYFRSNYLSVKALGGQCHAVGDAADDGVGELPPELHGEQVVCLLSKGDRNLGSGLLEIGTDADFKISCAFKAGYDVVSNWIDRASED